ncbi:GntR family transcriptional regulator [Poriferisphaera sp. WC338]|uniref:GntR family transcriptional regulator n=1 Tax=Poriferisphaera sp. WC338 TaxID=3425129 RepID=UPI003D812B43
MSQSTLKQQEPERESIHKLAAEIEHDMLLRGLEPGDKYLTAADVGQMLSVSRITANRAMQWLAQKDILVRARSRGTFVGPKFNSPLQRTRPDIDSLHVLLPMDYSRSVMQIDSFAAALSSSLPGANLHLHYLAEYDPLKTVRGVVEQIKNEDGINCMILIRSDERVQQYVSESGVPAVVFGSLYPGVQRLSSLDSDMGGAGKIATEHAMEIGCQKFMVIFRHEWLWGDNLLLNNIMNTLGHAGRNIDDLIVRSLGPSQEIIEGECRRLLQNIDSPTAMICVGENFARIAHRVLQDMQPKHHVEIIVATRVQSGDTTTYTRVVANEDGAGQVKLLCGLLESYIQNKETKEITIPVSIKRVGEPDWSA